MPLISPMPSSQSAAVQLEDRKSLKSSNSFRSLKQERDPRFGDFEEVNNEYSDSDMEGSVMNRNNSSLRPALPQRSEKRNSRHMESTVELLSLEISTEKTIGQRVEASDPHEQYLSSEEDVSFSEYDDDLDSLMDFESSPETGTEAGTPPGSRGSSRKSQEDTARAVSIVIVGKPQLVQIHIHSPKKHQQRPTEPKSSPRPLPLKFSTTSRLSVSSIASAQCSAMSRSQTTSFISSSSLPTTSTQTLRKASRMSNLSALVTTTKPSFLANDPFLEVSTLQSTTSPSSPPTTPTLKPPKTPISAAAAAWKTSITRTLSIARKTSTPIMARSHTGAILAPNSALSRHLEEGEQFHQQGRQLASNMPRMAASGPMRLEGVVEAVSGRPENKERAYSLGIYGLGRRKGLRGRNDRYIG